MEAILWLLSSLLPHPLLHRHSAHLNSIMTQGEHKNFSKGILLIAKRESLPQPYLNRSLSDEASETEWGWA